MINMYILSLACFATMDFSEQYHIEGRNEMRSPIPDKTYQQ
jgi:hypothetical protein